MDHEIFASIVAGLEEAIAYQRDGLLMPGARLTRFEPLPDGTVRRIVEEVAGPAPDPAPAATR